MFAGALYIPNMVTFCTALPRTLCTLLKICTFNLRNAECTRHNSRNTINNIHLITITHSQRSHTRSITNTHAISDLERKRVAACILIKNMLYWMHTARELLLAVIHIHVYINTYTYNMHVHHNASIEYAHHQSNNNDNNNSEEVVSRTCSTRARWLQSTHCNEG